MDKDTAENFIMTTLVENEKKKPKDKLSRKDIVDILTEDHGVPIATAYRYYKDQLNLYKWEISKPDPDKQLKIVKTKYSQTYWTVRMTFTLTGRLKSIAALSTFIQNYL